MFTIAMHSLCDCRQVTYVDWWRRCSPAQFTLICGQVEGVFTCPIHVDMSTGGGGVHLLNSTLMCQQVEEVFTFPVHVDLSTGGGGVHLLNSR